MSNAIMSKKSLLTFTCVLFVSLCSPIKAETTNKERFVRAFNYGFLPQFSFLTDEFIVDKCFPESDRNLLGKKRFLVNGVALGGAIAGVIVGGIASYFFNNNDENFNNYMYIGSVFGGAACGLYAGYFLEKRVKNNRFKELEKITIKKKKEREEHESVTL